MRVTVLGAGYMGSAMAKVAAKRGHQVRLWGTWLDDSMLDPVQSGLPHPRLGLVLDDMEIFRADALADALSGAELVIHGVSSDGVVPVMERARSLLPDVPIVSVTKGFLENRQGRMARVDELMCETAGRPMRVVHASGPAKAIEIARDVLTLMSFASADESDARLAAEALRGHGLVVRTTSDIAGAEICSALKNAYATGLGLWDGYVGKDAHNARAAGFTQAIAEMHQVVVASGGDAATVMGPAGVGDLHVTAAAGRNRAFGEQIGRGKPAGEVAADMARIGQLTEGYPAIQSAHRYCQERGLSNLPFLTMLYEVVYEGKPVGKALAELAI